MAKEYYSLNSPTTEMSSPSQAREQWPPKDQACAEEAVAEMLANTRALETRHNQSSRFRHICRRLEPLVKFLVMYSPAVDMMVQFDVHPSALIWGSLKAILNVRST